MNLYVFIYYLKKIENLNVYMLYKIHYTLTVRENMTTFTIECDQQTIEQVVLDCIEVKKLLSGLHRDIYGRHEIETGWIGRALTECSNIEIFLREIMKREFETSAASTMRTFTIECDQQTIEQVVFDCIAVKKLLSNLHGDIYGRSECETRWIGRALTECSNIEIFLREIMKREFETRNASTMSSAVITMSSAAITMSSAASTMSSAAITMSSATSTMSSDDEE